MLSIHRLESRNVAVACASLILAALLTVALCAPAGVARQPQGTTTPGWITLFNGKDLSGWRLRDSKGPNGWEVADGIYTTTPPSTDLQTEAEYYDFELHVEFNISPAGNSGVYMRDRYEVQILDDYGKPPKLNGCGSLYRKVAPAINASKPAAEWQSFDITFIGRRLTVIHNGQKVLDNVETGPMGTGAASNRGDGPGPLRLQGDHGAVSFRNVRLRPLSKSEAERLLKKMSGPLR